MLTPGRISLNRRETQAVEQLLADHPDAAASLTRRDRGEKGPVLVHLDHRTYEVDRRGNATKVA